MRFLLSKKARFVVVVATVFLVVVAAFMVRFVKTNYDMTVYLPEDSMTAQGLEKLDETFGNTATVQVMVEVDDVEASLDVKHLIYQVDGVVRVVWLDDVADVSDVEGIAPELMALYYQEGKALYTVIFAEDSYSLAVSDGILQLETVLSDYTIYMRGEAVDNNEAKAIAEGEVFKMILIILPVCFVILLFASKSWIEPVLILGTLGVAVLFNMATNALLPHVSFITLTIAAALQLAISLDYSLFLIHRYQEYHDAGMSTHDAVVKATKRSFPVITASALTTMVGFMALLFMQYGIGFDIGVVLSKGIVFSYLTVLFLLPVLIVIFSRVIEKTRHRTFLFNLGFLSGVFIRYRYGLIILLIVLAGGGYYYQNQAEFMFGTSQYIDGESVVYQDKIAMRTVFGVYEPVLILVEQKDLSEEALFVGDVEAMDAVMYVDSLVGTVGTGVPIDFLPEAVVSMYRMDGFSRFIVYTSIVEEDEAMFAWNDDMEVLLKGHYESYYMIGVVPSITEIRDTVIADTIVVMIVSVVAIGMVLLLVFRRVLIPVLLLVVIQASIWVNVGFLGVFDTQVVYIGYLVVLALQLGATIDYAVLLSSRYIEMRDERNKSDAMRESLRRSSIPIMISGLVLATAGFVEAIFSDLSVVADIGLLIGRGALLSMVFVLVLLPALLFVCDRWFIKGK